MCLGLFTFSSRNFSAPPQLTHATPSTAWVFNMCDDVLLGPALNGSAPLTQAGLFGYLQYSLRVASSSGDGASSVTSAGRVAAVPASAFTRSAITKAEGCIVTVSTETPVAGTVYLEADQSTQNTSGSW
jgi:hypothetical protein